MRSANYVLLGLIAALAACTTTIEGDSQAVKVDSLRSAESHTRLSAGYYGIKQYKVALQEAEIAVQQKPDYSPAYTMLGLIYMDLAENDKAEVNFKKALALDPTDSDAKHNYGVFLCNNRREQESKDYFLAAVRDPLYNGTNKSLRMAAGCLKKIGKRDEAKPLLQRILTTMPDDGVALYELADMAYSDGDLLGARLLLKKMGTSPASKHTAQSLLLGWRVERGLRDALGERRFAEQLKRDFPDSTEAGQLQ